MLSSETQQLCHLFAATLDYPNKSLEAATQDCASALAQSFPEITAPMRTFADFVSRQSVEALEELYVQTFDVTPASSLYLGYHLFGETPKRSVFLTRLEEAYHDHSFSRGIELADHLGVILRFLSVTRDWKFAEPLLGECILPTLAHLEEALRKNDNQYYLVLGALRMFLQRVASKMGMAGGVQNA